MPQGRQARAEVYVSHQGLTEKARAEADVTHEGLTHGEVTSIKGSKAGAPFAFVVLLGLAGSPYHLWGDRHAVCTRNIAMIR